MVISSFANTKNVVLVDGTNLLIRIFKAKTSGGTTYTANEILEACSIIFMQSLANTIKKYTASRVYVCFDLGGSFRKRSIQKEYKANREVVSTTGVQAIFGEEGNPITDLKDKVAALCRSFNIPVLMELGIEADDMIGIAVQIFASMNTPVIVLSNDSDFLQFTVYSNVLLDIPYKKAQLSGNGFTAYFETMKGISILPSEYVFYKAAVGDKSDNIDGIAGFGYKTLHKKLSAYLDANPEMTEKYLSDKLDFIECVSQKNTDPFEKTICQYKDILLRNFKLIELSSAYVSSRCQTLVLNFLAQVSEKPNKLTIMKDYMALFGVPTQFAFVDSTISSLSSVYKLAQ